MSPLRTRWPAHLLDGRSAVPQRGELVLEAADVVLRQEGRVVFRSPLEEVVALNAVAGEVHLAFPEDSDGVAPRVTVLDSAALPVLEEALAVQGGGRAASRASRRLGLRGWIVVAAVAVPALFLAYDRLLPRLHVLVSKEREAALGETVYGAVKDEWRVVEDAEFRRVVDAMVAELREPGLDFDLRVDLVDVDEINAVALPGGRILVFKGLLAASPTPDAFAGVLAHEMVHVEQRHSLKHMIRSLGLLHFATGAVGGGIDGLEAAETIVEASTGLLVLSHSRGHESEADRIAVQKLQRAGRSARGLIEFFGRVRERYGEMPPSLAWVSTHPLTQKRISEVRRLTAGDPKARPWMTPEGWEDFRARFAP